MVPDSNHPHPLPGHGPCFVCGEHGFLKAVWHHDRERGLITTTVCFGEGQQGPPGHVHGGALFAVLDEAMGASVWLNGHRAVAAQVSIRYLKPVPLDTEVTVEAGCGPREGRRVPACGVLRLPGGQEAARTEGVFVESLGLFEGHAFWPAAREASGMPSPPGKAPSPDETAP